MTKDDQTLKSKAEVGDDKKDTTLNQLEHKSLAISPTQPKEAMGDDQKDTTQNQLEQKPSAISPAQPKEAMGDDKKVTTLSQPGQKPPAISPAQPKEEVSGDQKEAIKGQPEQKPSDKRPARRIEPTEAHVLVVEDNVPNFVLIARMLAYMGVQRCEWKTSGWQVVEFADTLPRIDLILMDIRLPYEDGFQALEKLRSNSRLKDTLVVAVTAEASVEHMARAKKSGFDGFLGKPLDPDRFPDQIRRVLSGEPVWEVH
jgi:two-component system cell cycle response regulator DivK